MEYCRLCCIDLVDICGGKMPLDEALNEVRRYMFQKKPQRLVLDIQENHTTIYIDKKAFKGG